MLRQVQRERESERQRREMQRWRNVREERGEKARTVNGSSSTREHCFNEM